LNDRTILRNTDIETARQRVRQVIDHLTVDGTAVARLDGSSHKIFPVATSPEEGEALRAWVTRERATYTIEIGLGYGISTLHICEGLVENANVDASHVAIDPYQETRFANCALQFLDDAGVRSLVEHYPEDSQVVLPRLLSTSRHFDLAFVDGNHRFDGVFVDLAYLRRLLRPGGIVFIDDYQLPSVTKSVSYFVTNLGWKLEDSSFANDQHHWAVLRTGVQADTRSFDHFIEF
jgi:predicted O-methyltransferase YrrM